MHTRALNLQFVRVLDGAAVLVRHKLELAEMQYAGDDVPNLCMHTVRWIMRTHARHSIT
jgi:hypothetical protein